MINIAIKDMSDVGSSRLISGHSYSTESPSKERASVILNGDAVVACHGPAKEVHDVLCATLAYASGGERCHFCGDTSSPLCYRGGDRCAGCGAL